MKPVIPIFFTFDRYYVLAACVAFYSLLEKASRKYQYHLYVVHTGLKAHHQQRLQKVVSRFPDATLTFVTAPENNTGWNELQNKAHFSKEIFYKMTAASMFPQYDRILFSDVDVIFLDDISESYSLFPNDKFYFAGTRPIGKNNNLVHYQNDFTAAEIETISQYEISAGYMLINLKAIRQDNMEERLTTCFKDNLWRLRLPEQDCIALCCHPYICFMDYRYMIVNSLFQADPDTMAFNANNPLLHDSQKAKETLLAALEHVVQLHYPSEYKPWNNRHVLKFAEWMSVCRRAGLYGYYLRLQPLFVYQRLKRYSLKRFLKKMKARIKI